MTNGNPTETKDFFEQYWRYNSALRNWFIGFGVGLGLLLVTDKADCFVNIPANEKTILLIFLILGVIVQIILAFINKTIHWYLYRGSEDEQYREKICYKISSFLSNCFFIDLTADLITFLAFGFVIYKVITLLLI